jgi:hypothetical protein
VYNSKLSFYRFFKTALVVQLLSIAFYNAKSEDTYTLPLKTGERSFLSIPEGSVFKMRWGFGRNGSTLGVETACRFSTNATWTTLHYNSLLGYLTSVRLPEIAGPAELRFGSASSDGAVTYSITEASSGNSTAYLGTNRPATMSVEISQDGKTWSTYTTNSVNATNHSRLFRLRLK